MSPQYKWPYGSRSNVEHVSTLRRWLNFASEGGWINPITLKVKAEKIRRNIKNIIGRKWWIMAPKWILEQCIERRNRNIYK